MEERDPYCINGHWEDGVCVCKQGYRTAFKEIALEPRYCATDITVVIGNDPYDSEKLLHWTAMAFTVIVTSISIIALVSLLYSLLALFWTKHRVRESRQAVMLFDAQQVRLSEEQILIAEIWEVPGNFQCIFPTDQRDGAVKVVAEKPLKAKVLHKYKAQAKDEMSLEPGDVITDVVKLEQGWCKGTKNGKTGFFPSAFVAVMDPEAG